MLSFTIMLCLLALSITLSAWAMSFAARKMGSPRGRIAMGFVAVALFCLVNIAMWLISVFLFPQPQTLGGAILSGIVTLGVQLSAFFAIVKRVFELPANRALVVLGAHIGATIAAVVVALGIMRPFMTEAFIMPTASMSPTIDPDDRFFGTKLVSPRRWDLVIYWNNDQGGRQRYVKRLVALPGERLRFSGGGIFINDQPVVVPAVLAGKCRATLPGSAGTTLRRYHEKETITLGNDEYFLIGDNIDISADSRIYGPTSAKDIVGVVDLIYWPIKKFHVVR